MFLSWLFAIFFYWTEYFYIGFLICILSAIWEIWRSKKKTVEFRFFLLGLLFFSSYLYGHFVYQQVNVTGPAISTIHMLLVTLSCAITRPKYSNDQFKIFVFPFVVSATFLSIIGRFVWSDSLYFVNVYNVWRYEFFFSEPSYFAIFSCFILYFVLFKLNVADKSKKILIFLSIVNIVLTTSGSGLLLLLFLMVLKVLKSPIVTKLKIILLIALVTPISYPLFNDTIAWQFISERATKNLSGNIDRSAQLRFLAPKYLSEYTVKNYPIFGVGYGHTKTHIQNNYSEFEYMVKINSDGDFYNNSNIDNSWVALFFSTGILGVLVFSCCFYYSRLQKKITHSFLVFVMVVMFFSGSIAQPLIIGSLFYRES